MPPAPPIHGRLGTTVPGWWRSAPPERLWWDHNAYSTSGCCGSFIQCPERVLDVGCGSGRLACTS